MSRAGSLVADIENGGDTGILAIVRRLALVKSINGHSIYPRPAIQKRT
jgi:hypothetical protein